MSKNSVLEGQQPEHQSTLDTQNHILEVALRLMQTGGYHAFSYADIAAEVDITKASIHYHYPSKAELGREALKSYRAGWRHNLRRLEASGSAEARLRGYSRVYRDLLRGGRLCLVAALAPESRGLSADMQAELNAFYAEHQAWLEEALRLEARGGTLNLVGPLSVQARALLSSLHGALAMAHVVRDVYRYCAVAHLTLAQLGLPISELEISDPAAFEEAEALAAGLAFA